MHNAEGEQVWERSLDTFGKVKHGDNNSCPFMYQGQYYDAEIELAYNRFRYYDPEDGRYISQDPIGLLSGEYNFYSYIDDPNAEIDPLGLAKSYTSKRKNYDLTQKGALSEFNGKQGVYIHSFKTSTGQIKTYTGKATDLGKRPKTSLNEVIAKKGAAGDTYLGTKIKVAKKPISEVELNTIEHKYMTKNGGHKSPKTYNSRASSGFGT